MKNNQNMKKFIKKSAVIFSFLSIASCAIANPPSGPGVIFTDVKELVYYDGSVSSVLTSVICSKNILGLVSTGDAGLNIVKLQTKIKKIASIEKTYESSFLIYAKSCLIVKGQNF